MIVGTGWREIVPTLHIYVSSGTGNASCCKYHFAATALDYHVTIRQNVVAKATENF